MLLRFALKRNKIAKSNSFLFLFHKNTNDENIECSPFHNRDQFPWLESLKSQFRSLQTCCFSPYQVGVKEAGVQDQEDVVDRKAAQEVEEEPGLHVLHRDQPRLQDHLLAVIALLEP